MTETRGSTDVKRGTIPAKVKVALWARCAGRCTMCNEHVNDGPRTWYHTVLTGEMAHILGAKPTEGSPRGLAESGDDREALENLMLLCHDCHKVIDDPEHQHLYTTDRLREIKERHERRIALMTREGGLTRTAVVNVGADVRGTFTIASRRNIGEVLIREDYLPLVESQILGDFTCRIPNDDTYTTFWETGRERIDKTLSLVMQAVSAEHIEHIAVFAIGPIPLLVHLGAALDDKTPTRVYQLHRSTASWGWPDEGAVIDFECTVEPGTTDEVVLVVQVTANVKVDLIPAELHRATRITLTPVDGQFGPDIINDVGTLTKFREAFAAMLARAEEVAPAARGWHLVVATPVAPAVEMGRAFMRSAHPPVTVYQRTDTAYDPVLTVNS